MSAGRRACLGLVVAVAAALLVSCSPADDPEPRIAQLDFEPVATLVVDETGFDPDRLELATGDSVLLVNEGDEPHSFVVSDPFRDTGDVLPGEEVLLRFDEEGELDAHDGRDPERTVVIVVEEAPDQS